MYIEPCWGESTVQLDFYFSPLYNDVDKSSVEILVSKSWVNKYLAITMVDDGHLLK